MDGSRDEDAFEGERLERDLECALTSSEIEALARRRQRLAEALSDVDALLAPDLEPMTALDAERL